MFNVAFILGPVVFQDFEATAGVGFGGEQRLVIHRTVGGGRVIDSLGRDDREITVSGAFSGSDATVRARLLDELRASGLPLSLTWDVFLYDVVIRDFRADYRNTYWIPYRLSCTVVQDEVSAVIGSAISLAGTVSSDIATVAGLTPSDIDLGGLQAAVVRPKAMTLGTSDYAQTTSSVIAAQSSMYMDMTAAGTSLAAASTTINSVTDPVSGAAALRSATQAAGRLSAVASARGYLGRAAVNLANAST